MMSWVSLLFEAGLAVLMVALIFYCIKLNKRLSVLRSQNADIADMLAGLSEASERAEQSVLHLKSAGLSAEKSLRTVIEEAAVLQRGLARQVSVASGPSAPPAAPPSAPDIVAAQSVPLNDHAGDGRPRDKVERDILTSEPVPSVADHKTSPPVGRPKTREEAEETVLQAIRSARIGT